MNNLETHIALAIIMMERFLLRCLRAITNTPAQRTVPQARQIEAPPATHSKPKNDEEKTMSDQQQPPQQNAPPADDAEKEIEKDFQEFIEHLGVKAKVLNDLNTDYTEISKSLKDMSNTLQELSKKDASTDEIRQQVEKVTGQISQFEKMFDKNDERLKALEPWDLGGKVHQEITEQKEAIGALSKKVQDFRDEYLLFSGGPESKPLMETTGTLADWLKFTSEFVVDGNRRVADLFQSHQHEMTTELDTQRSILQEVIKYMQDLKQNDLVTKKDIDGLVKLVTDVDTKTNDHHDEFIELLKKNTKLLEDMSPQTSNMDKIIGHFLDTEQMIQTLREHLDGRLDELKTRPVYNPDLSLKILGKVEALENKPNLETTLNEIQGKLKELSERPDRSQEMSDALAEIKKEVDELKKDMEPKFRGVKEAVLQVKQNSEQGGSQPSPDYTEQLKKIDEILESVKGRTDEEKTRLDEIKGILDDLNKRPHIDNTESLQQIQSALSELKNRPHIDYSLNLNGLAEQMTRDTNEIKGHVDISLQSVKDDLRDIKARPGLNIDLSGLLAEILGLKKLLGQEADRTVLKYLKDIETRLLERPGEKINPAEIANSLEKVQKTVEERPATSNNDEVLKKLAEIQGQVEKIDFSAVSKQVDTTHNDLQGLINRPYVPAGDLRKFMEGVNTDLGNLKERPIMKEDKPLLTQEHYDNSVVPMVEKLDAIYGEHEKSRGTWELLKNVHVGVNTMSTRPAYDPAPLKDLRQQLETFHKDDTENIKRLHDKVDAIDTGDTAQMQALLKQFETFHNDDHEKFKQLQDKVDAIDIGDTTQMQNLLKHFEGFHNENKEKFTSLHEKVEAITSEESPTEKQIKRLREELKDALLMEVEMRKIGAKKLGGAIKTLTKLSGGAVILSGLTAAGFFGFKIIDALTRGKKQPQQQQAQNMKRHHARSWKVDPALE